MWRQCAIKSSCPRLRSAIQLARRLVEILEECRTQPALHVELRRVIPVAAILLTPPLELDRITGKRRGREEQAEAFSRTRNRREEAIDHRIDSSHERLADEASRRVIEDP